MTLAAMGAAGGPSWTDILTGIGTVGAVIVALGIALYTDWRAGGRIKAEHDRSDRVLAEERERSRAALEDERAYGRAQLEEERLLARKREQLAGAYAVQVVNAQEFQMFRDATIEEVASGSVANPFGVSFAASFGVPYAAPSVQVDWTHLAVLIVNRGSYTITRVEVQFSPDGRSLVPPARGVRLLGFDELPERLKEDHLEPGADAAKADILTPWDTGLRFRADPIRAGRHQGPVFAGALDRPVGDVLGAQAWRGSADRG